MFATTCIYAHVSMQPTGSAANSGKDTSISFLGYGILARPKRRKKAPEMTTYKELQAQIEQLRKQAEELRQAEIADVITEIKAKMNEYGITGADLGLMGKKRIMKTSPAMTPEVPAPASAHVDAPASNEM
jgi:DNA-binding protein H-NS